MYQELLENAIEDDEGMRRLDDQAFASILQRTPIQEGGNEETDSSMEKFRFNFVDLRAHLLSVCIEFFSGERVSNCKEHEHNRSYLH